LRYEALTMGEDKGRKLLQNIGTCVPNYMVFTDKETEIFVETVLLL
jgi:hypothetical protein